MARRAVPAPAAQPATSARWDTAADAAVWALAILYAATFIVISWWRYHAFLMHALDMGNMEQAVWNTAHGHPFAFNNLRQHWQIEASGTTTRLSFHVEPILLLVAIPYLVFANPMNLVVIQALVVASGVFPAAWLARRYLKSPLATVAFPLAYTLSPSLQAATLYEFHAVTLAAGLLMWALYFADGRRYRLFGVFAVLAMATKEEIGLVVAMIGLWIWWRNRDRNVGLLTAILAAAWSFVAVFVIMKSFHQGASSPYCARFDPTIANGFTAASQHVSCIHVVKQWVLHPGQFFSLIVTTPKIGFVHRLMMTTGYLSLLSPLTLAISLPSYALILLSNDVHMYSGLGHYAAELIPVAIAAAIVGTAWLARVASARLRLPAPAIVTALCLWLVAASLASTRVDGFSPLAAGFAAPAYTAHEAAEQRIVDAVPPGASVAASDFLNPHLSDRRDIYLFPDIADAQYAAVDVSRDKFPLPPLQEMQFIRDRMLATGAWGVVRAEDGLILMERRRDAPGLPTALPAAFYTFVKPAAPPTIAHPMRVDLGPLQVLGYSVERREQVNVRLPDVLLTLYLRLTQPLTSPITPVVYLSNGTGALDEAVDDHPGTDWLPTTRWPVGAVMVLRTVSLPVYATRNGRVDIDLAVYRPGAYAELQDSAHRYPPRIVTQPPGAPVQAVGNATILKLTQLPIHW